VCVHLLHKGGPPSSVVDARRAAPTRPVPSETKKIPSLRHAIGHQIARCARSSEAVARRLALLVASVVWGYCARGLSVGSRLRMLLKSSRGAAALCWTRFMSG